MNLTKDTIRLEAMRHRDRIEADENDLEKAAELFMKEIAPKPEQVVAAYWPKGKEINPYPIMEHLLAEGIEIALPVVRKKMGKRLGFALWNEKVKLVKGAYGVMQPEANKKTKWVEPDILIAPLLAFDQKGIRLGYGGGYYDNTIRELRSEKEVVVVGLAYAGQACLFDLPREEHDEKMDWIITPVQSYRFS
jgi:5-formyltetrahydrofolate cyclo-ligase